MTPTLVFDIETVPDVAGLRTLHQLGSGLSDHDVAEFAFQRRRQQTGGDFLQLHLHRVIAISCALRAGSEFKVWSLGTAQDNEATLIQRFYDGVEKYTPQIVSWNGGGFDLPVLHYRGLINSVNASRYWDMGEEDKDFRWNNYISRYHSRHLDLMDLLAMYQPRANAPLDDLAQLMGLPGKLGMDGSKVWDAYQAGEISAIRNYCETDAVNSYLVFLRFQKMRGVFSDEQHQREMDLVRTTLDKSTDKHWKEFLAKWPAAAK
ncbi:MAG: 3'-5' exonuclease [Burkholderiales bacterium]